MSRPIPDAPRLWNASSRAGKDRSPLPRHLLRLRSLGYGWSFPYPHHQVLGIASLKPKIRCRLKDGFREFIASLSSPDPGALRIQSHGLPYGNYLRNPGYENVLLLGDAAGLADPFLEKGSTTHTAAHSWRHKRLSRAARIPTRPPAATATVSAAPFTLSCGMPAPAGRSFFPSRQISISLFWRHAAAHAKFCEETIQGQRSFKWFRRKETQAGAG